MRIWFSGRAQASQAWSAGSIPVIRLDENKTHDTRNVCGMGLILLYVI
ncbi:MAG: hypothetical protein K0R00_2781 [Herbinix sp.]|nr:hypothetical protein [Herbinix sp.]